MKGTGTAIRFVGSHFSQHFVRYRLKIFNTQQKKVQPWYRLRRCRERVESRGKCALRVFRILQAKSPTATSHQTKYSQIIDQFLFRLDAVSSGSNHRD